MNKPINKFKSMEDKNRDASGTILQSSSTLDSALSEILSSERLIATCFVTVAILLTKKWGLPSTLQLNLILLQRNAHVTALDYKPDSRRVMTL